MYRAISTTLAAAVVLACLPACGASDSEERALPTESFSRLPDSTRAYAGFRIVDGIGDRIEVPPGTSKVALHFDCSASSGELELTSKNGPIVSAACSAKPGEGKGVIANQLPADIQTIDLAVSVPAGGEWSAAVDLVP